LIKYVRKNHAGKTKIHDTRSKNTPVKVDTNPNTMRGYTTGNARIFVIIDIKEIFPKLYTIIGKVNA
jgi:hypothetical protein